MAREIGYFKYKNRSSVELYGSGDFYSTKDDGYIYGWSQDTTTFKIRAYLKTFNPDTTGSKAGIQLRKQAYDNLPFVGMMVDGDGFIKIYSRSSIDGTVVTSYPVDINQTQGIWLEMDVVDHINTCKYSLNAETTSPSSISWTTLVTRADYSLTSGIFEKHLCCSSGSDDVNLAYFTKVYTENGWISPIGQKE
jgi:hypothetical protein